MHISLTNETFHAFEMLSCWKMFNLFFSTTFVKWKMTKI